MFRTTNHHLTQIYLLFLVVTTFLVGCGKESSSKDDKTSSKEMEEFEHRAYDIRCRLLHQHTYDWNNLPIVDSLYKESEKIHSDYGKLMALQVRYYVYSAYPSKEDDLIRTVDEVIALTDGKPEYNAEYYDAVSTKVDYLIEHKKYMAAQYLAKEMMSVAEKSKDKEGLYYANYTMGAIYQNRGNFSISIPYFLKAEECSNGDSISITRAARDIAINYNDMRKYDLAMKYALRCKQYATSLIYQIWAEYTYLITLYDSGKEEEFLNAYEKSLIISTDDMNGVLPADMQAELKLRKAAAMGEWDTALSIAQKIRSEKSRNKEIYTIYLHKSDYKAAFDAKQKLNEIEEKIQSEILMDDLSEMETRLGNSQLKLQAEELQLDRQHMKYLTLIVIIIAILGFTILGVINIARRRTQLQRQKIEEERETFYRNVTHQLRTPMTVVMGMIEQLRAHISPDDKVGMDSLDAAHRQSNNLMELIKKLISASKEGKLDQSLISAQGEITNATEADSGAKKTTDGNIFLSMAKKGVNRILVAEDNDDVALMVCNMLYNAGYSVMRATDGQEAWEMLQDELPDLLLTDIAMPRMDGLELMRHVRADDTISHLPIIVVSARVKDNQRMEGISAGAEVYLAKPFINEELLLRVKNILEQRERLRRKFSNNMVVDVQSGTSDEEHRFICEVNKVIDDNMKSGDVTTTFLTERLGMSASTLNRKLKNITNMSSTVYIRTRRLIVAKQLLETTNKSVTEIEYACGFNTPGYFTRIFKAEMGISPTDYRRDHMENSSKID